MNQAQAERSKGGEEKEEPGVMYTYLGVGREEGQLQRPAVLDAAGDHACEEELEEAQELLPAIDDIAVSALDLAGLLQGEGQLDLAGLLEVTPAFLHGQGLSYGRRRNKYAAVSQREEERKRRRDGMGEQTPRFKGGF